MKPKWNEPIDYVEYIKSHVKEDLEINRESSGEDYSMYLGSTLHNYLVIPYNKQVVFEWGMRRLGMLEDRLKRETGKFTTFHETKKCALAVHELWKAGDREGLAEIKRYANGLMGFNSTPG